MNFRILFSSCIFGHASYPFLIVQKGIARWECQRCQADLGAVLGVEELRHTPHGGRWSLRSSSYTVAAARRKREHGAV